MSLEKIYQTWKDKAEFFVIYIREAHPTDGWMLPGNEKIQVQDPTTLEERRAVAGRCMKDLGFSIPPLVDDMNDAANLAYAGWPERLYVIGKDGKIAYAGGMGPMHFSPNECAAFLKEYLSNPDNCSVGAAATPPAPAR